METISRSQNRINRLAAEVASLPLDLGLLSRHKTELGEQWNQFQAALNEAREVIISTDGAQSVEQLEHQVRATVQRAQASLDMKISETISAQLTTERETTSDPKSAQLPAESIQSPPTNSEEKSKEPPQPVGSAGPSDPTSEKDRHKELLDILLHHIAENFNDILSGKFDTPAKPDRDILKIDDPVLGVKVGINQSGNMHKISVEDTQVQTEEMVAAPVGRDKIKPDPQLPSIELKLDKMQLPTFDGDLTQWIAFRDQYIDLVHENPKLTTITKFCQLRSHLSGLALDAINGFSLTTTDYEAAWFVLRKRYDKKDRIIDEYLRKFEDLPRLTHPTAVNLINMVNRTNQLIRVMPLLGVDIKAWDTWIKFNLKTRLDRATHRKWLDQIKLRQDVTLQELLEFLEVEAAECLPMEYEPQRHAQRRSPFKQPQKRSQGKRNPTTMIVEQQQSAQKIPPKKHARSCELCKNDHFIHLCPTFLALAVTDRIKKVKQLNLCIRCLRKHEHPADCKFGACPVCKKDHNSILCYRKEKEAQAAQHAPQPTEPKVTNISASD